jgi:hypothetical protein
VSTSPPDDASERWRNALLDLLHDPASIMAWQDRRYRFAYEVGRLLVDPASPGGAPLSGPALYGVWVSGSGLLYIGQTKDARRRLQDLLVGESHHLATTVPPETWERIIVVQWPSLLPGLPPDEARTAARLGLHACGLAMEHLLQMTYRPVMTARRRRGAGVWTARNLDSSRSVGAVSGTALPELFRSVHALWETLAETPEPGPGEPASYLDGGRVVFPASLYSK